MGNSTLTMGKRSKEVQAEDPQDHTNPTSKQKKVAAKETGEEATMDSLVKNAECIVCYDVPRGHVYSCKNGHIICHTCEARLKSTNRGQVFNCPECRVPYTGCRNLFVSKFLEYYYRETPLKCKFMGCDFTALLKDLLGHENLCIVPLLEATRSCLICLDLENMIMHKLNVSTIVHRCRKCSCLPGFEAFIPLPSAVQSRF